MAYYGDKTPKGAFDAQRPRIRCLWGLTTQVGGVRLTIGRCTKFISSGDSEDPVTDFEVDQDAGTFGNYQFTNPYHGQGAFASSWRAGSEQNKWGFCSFGFVLIFPSGNAKKKRHAPEAPVF